VGVVYSLGELARRRDGLAPRSDPTHRV
jgi:hypothetical protein